MNKAIVIIIIIISAIITNCFSDNYKTERINKIDDNIENKIKLIWEECNISDVISYDIFRTAMIGYYNIDNLKKKDKLIIIDYSKPSTKERFFVIDIVEKKLIYHCLVAHGKNTGENISKYFSNKSQSKKSCLGFFITAETYYGKHGYSLKLDGIEKNINDNARKRLIVIHGADYVSRGFIEKHGRLGRSWGCPALPNELSKEIIDAIFGGQCLFIYGNDKDYLINSNYIEK